MEGSVRKKMDENRCKGCSKLYVMKSSRPGWFFCIGVKDPPEGVYKDDRVRLCIGKNLDEEKETGKVVGELFMTSKESTSIGVALIRAGFYEELQRKER